MMNRNLMKERKKSDLNVDYEGRYKLYSLVK